MAAVEDTFQLDDDVGAGIDRADAPPLKYDGISKEIPGLPTRADLVRKSDVTGLTDNLASQIREGKVVFFMPNDTNESNEYVAGVPVYKFHLFGALANGAKAHVIIDGIEVFFDVRVPEGKEADFTSHLRQVLLENNTPAERFESIEAFPVQGFRKNKVAWKRIYFPNTQQRRKAIDVMRALGYQTASDDLTNYFRMASRLYGFVLTDWGMLTNYVYYRGGTNADGPTDPKNRAVPKSPLCEHIFRVNTKDFKPFIDPMAPKDVQNARSEAKRSKPSLARDKSLELTWDIETRSTSDIGDVPIATNSTDQSFMICMTVHWKDDTTPLHQVCIVDAPTRPDPRWTTIECDDEEGLIKAFAVVVRHFAPDFISGFNDGQYDWPFIIEKATQYGILSFLADTMTAMPRGTTTEEGVLKWNVGRPKKIKISAEDVMEVSFLKVPGYIPIDVRVMFKKLFPKAEVGKGSSLSFYLKMCNLGSKADMPYTRMHKIIRQAIEAPGSNEEEMRQVAHYCVIDALRCQQLLVKRNVINDRREVSALSYVSLYDAIYFADGHKVCNMLIAYAIRRDILCSNITRDEGEHGKYPGAWVFHPEKGLVPDPTLEGTVNLEKARAEYMDLVEKAKTDPAVYEKLEAAKKHVLECLEKYSPGRPVTGLDFSSLYPSIIMAYNLSPETFVSTEEEARALEAEGYNLHYTEFEFNGRKIYGWFVRHECETEKYGLYPSILIDLFNKRALMKVGLGIQEELKEHMELVMGLLKKDGAELVPVLESQIEELRPEIDKKPKEAEAIKRNIEYMETVLAKPDPAAAFRQRYNEVCFDFMSIDSKQKALKVFMNTFYGEAGHSISPFFLLQLAGGVTTAGQFNIKLVEKIVLEAGFHIKYGDTDSVYLSAPDRVFADADRRYALGETSKEEYWAEMVEITMDELSTLRDHVNRTLRDNNGTPHLKMAYEEVLFPVVFTGKKKYFGIAHVNVPNFHPKKLFIRGIDVVKQGQTNLARTIGHKIMWRSAALDNTQSLQAIVEDVLREAVINGDQWTFDDFVQTAAWKPHKKNIPVQTFMARMKIRVEDEKADNARRIARGEPGAKSIYYIPDSGERFEYVLVKLGATFNIQGRKSNPKTGDMMEYAEVARALGLKIHVAEYLTRYVVGLCARFINYSDQFALPPLACERLDKKAQDKKIQEMAKRYLITFVSGLQDADPKTMTKRGYAYKRAWRKAAQECGDELFEKAGTCATILHGKHVYWADFLPDEGEPVENLAAQAKEMAEELAQGKEAEFANAYCARLGIGSSGTNVDDDTSSRLFEISRLVIPGARRGSRRPTPHQMTMSAYDRIENSARRGLAELVPAISETAMRYEASLARAVDQWRAREHEALPDDLGEFGPGSMMGGALKDPQDRSEFDLSPEEIARLKKARDLWYKLVGVYRARINHRAAAARLLTLKDRRIGRTAPPKRETVRRVIAETAQNLPPMNLGTIGAGGY